MSGADSSGDDALKQSVLGLRKSGDEAMAVSV